MELNLTENKFSVNNCLYKGAGEIDITTDINLPDYCSDVAKILKTILVPEITSKTLSEKRISIEGNAKITMIYCDTSGKVRSYTITEPYIKNFESDDDLSDGKLSITIKNIKVTARSLSPRKTEIKGSFDLSAQVNNKKDIKIISNVSGGGAESECGEIEAENYVALENKLIVLDELLDIGGGNAPIGEIIKYDISPKLREVKQIANKIILKGETDIKILYIADNEEGSIEEFETSCLISQIIDVEGADEDSVCFADIKLLSASVKGKSDANGEVRSLSTEIILEVSLECKKKIMLPVVLDAYSTECEMQIERQLQPFSNLADTFLKVRFIKRI
jgi:hypothetical protein